VLQKPPARPGLDVASQCLFCKLKLIVAGEGWQECQSGDLSAVAETAKTARRTPGRAADDRSGDARAADYGHLIVDECHHLQAFVFSRTLRQADCPDVIVSDKPAETLATPNSPWCKCVVAPRPVMRPAGKARDARIWPIFERRATQPGGMQRRSNADGLAPRAAKASRGKDIWLFGGGVSLLPSPGVQRRRRGRCDRAPRLPIGLGGLIRKQAQAAGLLHRVPAGVTLTWQRWRSPRIL